MTLALLQSAFSILSVLAHVGVAAAVDVARAFATTANVLMALTGLLLVRLLMLWLLQRHLNKHVGALKPGESLTRWWRRELIFSNGMQAVATFLGVLLSPILVPVGVMWGLVKAGKAAAAAVKKRRAKAAAGAPDASGADAEDGQEPAPAAEPPAEPAGVLVASMTPSLLEAAGVAWTLWLLSCALDWLLSVRFGLGSGAAGLDYVILGTSPDLAWLWPLERDPAVHLAVSAVLWLGIWSWSARIIRIVQATDIARNLYVDADSFTGLQRWRRWYGTWEIWQPHASFRAWAVWLALISSVLLILAAFSLQPTPYRVAPAPFVLAVLSCFSLAVHLLFKGRFEPVSAAAVVETSNVTVRGWLDVRDDLEARLRVQFPPHSDRFRHVARLNLQSDGLVADGWMWQELGKRLERGTGDLSRPGTIGLAPLQARMLAELNANRPAGLRLQSAPQGGLDLQPARSPTHAGAGLVRLCIMAPAGSGKTTASVLAACETAVIESRSTLVICRNESAATQWRERFERIVSPTTLRWNIRTAQIGINFHEMLARDEIPDIVTLSLEQLLAAVLGHDRSSELFLRRVGLVVIEDMESFCGTSENHLQLALRRLGRRLTQLGVTGQLDASRGSVAVMALLQPSSPDMDKWARAVLGDDQMAILRYAAGDDKDTTNTQFQQFVHVSQVRQPSGEAISRQDIVDSCERMGVPWSYRLAGDAHAGLGRSRLPLRQEPQYYQNDPADAAVILVEGSWAAVERERDLLTAAGRRFSVLRRMIDGQSVPQVPGPSDVEHAVRNTVAILSLVDGDEDMAFAEEDEDSELGKQLQRLPRPLARVPDGEVARAHLVAELASGIEVKEAIDLFGPVAADVLVALVRNDQARAVQRVDVLEDRLEHERLVDVSILQSALPTDDGILEREDAFTRDLILLQARLATCTDDVVRRELVLRIRDTRRKVRRPFDVPPPPVSCEVGAFGQVRLVDAAAARIVQVSDLDTVHYRYYPGRIFSLQAGRFIVIGSGATSRTDGKAGLARAGDLLVAPFLEPWETTPRRRIGLVFPDGADDAARGWSRSAEAWGRQAIEVTVGEADVRVRPIATVTYEPSRCAIVRRSLLTAEEQDHAEFASERTTRVVLLHPFSRLAAGADPNTAVVELQLGAARLVAAAMRMALPSLFRGAELSCGIAVVAGAEVDSVLAATVHRTTTSLAADFVLGPSDGIVLFDLSDGGSSVVGSIERDGLEVLLRMARRILERVLYHDRLLLRYDEWGDAAEILNLLAEQDKLLAAERQAGMASQATAAGASPAPGGSATSEPDEALFGDDQSSAPAVQAAPTGRRRQASDLRKNALTWMDAILMPEGWSPLADSSRTYGSSSEIGEGNSFDLGRVWYTSTGSVANLVWAKHRWRAAQGIEVAMDTGCDSATLAQADAWMLLGGVKARPDTGAQSQSTEFVHGRLRAEDQALLRRVATLLKDEQEALAPRKAYTHGAAGELIPSQGEVATDMLAQWLAAAAGTWRQTAGVAEFLSALWRGQTEAQSAVSGVVGPQQFRWLPEQSLVEREINGRITAVAALVQGMVNDPSRTGLATDPRLVAQSPVTTLMTRKGGHIDKALLFGSLAWHSGAQCGLFAYTGQRDKAPAVQAYGAFAISEVSEGDGLIISAVDAWRKVQAWAQAVRLITPPNLWAVAQALSSSGYPDKRQLVYVPVDLSADVAPGVAFVVDVTQWTFVPLSAARMAHAVPRVLKKPAHTQPPRIDPNAPPVPLPFEPRVFDPDPDTVRGDDVVKVFRFRDNNDNEQHSVEIAFSVSLLQQQVARFGFPTEQSGYSYRGEEDRKMQEQAWRDRLHGCMYVVDGDTICVDHARLTAHCAPDMAPVVEALRKGARGKTSGRAWAGLVASFAQAITYRIPEDSDYPGFVQTGLLVPLEVLARGWGDCDCKSVLFAAIMLAAEADAPVLVKVPRHMYAGVATERRATDVSVTIQSQTFALVELTAPFPLGAVADDQVRAGHPDSDAEFLTFDDMERPGAPRSDLPPVPTEA